MKTLSTERMISSPESNAVLGRVIWVPAKSLWTSAMLVVAVIGAPLTFSWDALALLVVTTAITICAGHSVGMHRLLIHRSFETPKWLEHVLVYLGTLVGMAGPFGMIAAHDIRDWAQRQSACHDLHAHRNGFFRDAWWQMHCAVALEHPPRFVIEPDVAQDRFYRFVERTWMLQQVPWAIMFFALGGISWVVWGIALRITLSLHGHWLVGHFAHRRGTQNWAVKDVAVQGYNIPNVSLLTFGEGWHGNHHAYPGSARLGLAKGELDPGFWLIKTFALLGLARHIKEPADVGDRPGLYQVNRRQRRYPKKIQLLGAWMTATCVGTLQMLVLEFFTGPAGSFSLRDVMGVIVILPFAALVSLVVMAAFVVPAIRVISTTAHSDQTHGLWFYATVAFFISLLPAFLGLYILVPFIIVPAVLAGLVFGHLNQQAIKRELAVA